MKRSIELINAMESTEKEQWINEYERRLKQALSSRDHLKAAYNRGILDQVKNNRVKNHETYHFIIFISVSHSSSECNGTRFVFLFR